MTRAAESGGDQRMMQRIAYAVLCPIMRLLHFRTEQRMQHLPQPVDAPRAHAPGSDPDRVLLFGSGPAIGYGVLTNDLALPGHLARQLSAITGRGVDLDVVSDPEVTIEGSLALLRDINLWRYDAILLTIGVNNALLLTSVTVWREAILELLSYVTAQVPSRTRVFVVAVPPIRSIDSFTTLSGWIADKHAIRLNRETRRIMQAFPDLTYVPFSPLARADDVRYRSTKTYQQWATIIVAPLSQQLMAEPRGGDHPRETNESVRQAALDATGILDTPPEERFDRIARLATQLLDTEYGEVMFVDHDRQWIKAGEHAGDAALRREGSFGEAVITAAGLLVVPDARADERFSGNPYVSGEPHIVFYAGYPIESALGERIGVIAVYDRHTRGWGDEESEILRDLALMVQRELGTESRSTE